MLFMENIYILSLLIRSISTKFGNCNLEEEVAKKEKDDIRKMSINQVSTNRLKWKI